MGVRPSLPMGGVQVILGNDLAGDRVWPEVPVAAVDTLTSQVEGSLVVMSTCAVTRAMSCVDGKSYVDNSDKKREPAFPVPVFHLPVSSSDLMKQQKADPSLQPLYSQILPDGVAKNAARGYFLQEGLLVRKWVPKGDCF